MEIRKRNGKPVKAGDIKEGVWLEIRFVDGKAFIGERLKPEPGQCGYCKESIYGVSYVQEKDDQDMFCCIWCLEFSKNEKRGKDES